MKKLSQEFFVRGEGEECQKTTLLHNIKSALKKMPHFYNNGIWFD